MIIRTEDYTTIRDTTVTLTAVHDSMRVLAVLPVNKTPEFSILDANFRSRFPKMKARALPFGLLRQAQA